MAQMLNQFRTVLFVYRTVIRPVTERTIVGIRKQTAVFRLRKKRFMGIESFNLKEPVVLVVILLQKIKSCSGKLNL